MKEIVKLRDMLKEALKSDNYQDKYRKQLANYAREKFEYRKDRFDFDWDDDDAIIDALVVGYGEHSAPSVLAVTDPEKDPVELESLLSDDCDVEDYDAASFIENIQNYVKFFNDCFKPETLKIMKEIAELEYK